MAAVPLVQARLAVSSFCGRCRNATFSVPYFLIRSAIAARTSLIRTEFDVQVTIDVTAGRQEASRELFNSISCCGLCRSNGSYLVNLCPWPIDSAYFGMQVIWSELKRSRRSLSTMARQPRSAKSPAWRASRRVCSLMLPLARYVMKLCTN